MNNIVHIVGGAGYIGSRLVPLLHEEGWDVNVIDAGVYKNVPVPDRKDVLELEPPGDGAPVIWLATIHREPAGFLSLEEEDKLKWIRKMEALMVDAPSKWIRAGHPLIYPSSMQVVAPMEASAYGWAKRLFEARWVGTAGVQILRFGTVWGSLDQEPARVETAINSSLLGKKLTDNYRAYTTHINRVLEALAYALCRNYLGTVENVTDSEDPVTGPRINEILKVPAQKRTVWAHLYTKELARATSLEKRLKKQRKPREHFTYALAAYYSLPWPDGVPTNYDIRAPIVPPPAPGGPPAVGDDRRDDVVDAQEGAGKPGAGAGGDDPVAAGDAVPAESEER